MTAARRPLPAYDGDEPYIFVSYSHEDDELVFPEIRWLQEHGFNVWWDEGISPGGAWRDDVARALRGCSLLLYYVTPSSVASSQCVREVNFGLDQHRRPVLAVHLVETRLPDALALSLGDRQAILRYELEPEDYARKLLSAVATYLETPVPPIDATALAPRARRSSRVTLPGAAALVVLGGAIAALATWTLTRPASPGAELAERFRIDLPPGVRLAADVYNPLDVTADGSRIVFTGDDARGRRLYVRPLDELDAAAIRGSEGASSFVLSPDGRWVGFNDRRGNSDPADDRFMKLPIAGGTPVEMFDFEWPVTDAAWARNGTLVFRSFAPDFAGLMRVSAAGGVPERLTSPEADAHHEHPHFVGDGDVLLYVEGVRVPGAIEHRIVARSLDDGAERVLTRGRSPRVTETGHLLFARDEAVWAARFDAGRLAIEGEPAQVLRDVRIREGRNAHFHVAANGSLVYWAGEAERLPARALVWVDRSGREEPLPFERAAYLEPRVAPDGRRVAAVVRTPDGQDIWIYSLERNVATRLTLDPAPETSPVWSPDGSMLAFASPRASRSWNLHAKNADGTGEARRLYASDGDQYPMSFSPDGAELLFAEIGESWDVGVLSVGGEAAAARRVLGSEFVEGAPMLSPNGGLLAYVSDESGRPEIYLRPWPDVDGGRWQVTADGARNPLWGPDGRELFYRDPSGAVMAVPVEAGSPLRLGSPHRLFEARGYAVRGGRNYDVTPDGQRFLMVRVGPSEIARDPDGGEERIVVVLNWTDALARSLPAD